MADLAELSVYVHIPFCASRCRYCDFYTVPGVFARDFFGRYLAAVADELRRGLDTYAPASVPTAYIGGGTPSLVPPDLFGDFLIELAAIWGAPIELSVEANPESLTREFLDAARAGGVNRISLGAQTYSSELLGWLGRPAGADAVVRADRLLRKHWKGRVSRDLLAALPGRPGRLEEDLETALAEESGHISLYELTVEPGTPLAADPQRLAELPDEEARLDEWQRALDLLSRRGYSRYEVSSFAESGRECLHNLRCWALRPYLGVGPGAASTLPAGASAGGGARRIKAVEDLGRWMADPSAAAESVLLTPGEFALEHYMTALRTAEGLSRSRFSAVFGADPVELAAAGVRRWEQRGLLRVEPGRMALSSPGLDLLDSILPEIARELEERGPLPGFSWPPS